VAHHIFCLFYRTGQGCWRASDNRGGLRRNAYVVSQGECELVPFSSKPLARRNYFRIMHQIKSRAPNRKKRRVATFMSHSRLSRGISFCFISHVGRFSLAVIWSWIAVMYRNRLCRNLENSEVFRNLHDLSKYGGKCGRCEFIKICAAAARGRMKQTGDYWRRSRCVLYQPKGC